MQTRECVEWIGDGDDVVMTCDARAGSSVVIFSNLCCFSLSGGIACFFLLFFFFVILDEFGYPTIAVLCVSLKKKREFEVFFNLG